MNLTQGGLAERLGVTGNTVARWERDEMAIPPYLDLALTQLESPKPKRRQLFEPLNRQVPHLAKVAKKPESEE